MLKIIYAYRIGENKMAVTLDYLEDERKKLWTEVVKQTDVLNAMLTNMQEFKEQLKEIKTIAENKVSDDESIIKGIRNKTSEYKNKIIDSYNTAEETLKELQQKSTVIEELSQSIQEISKNVNALKAGIEEKSKEIENIYDTITDINNNYDEELEKCTNFVNESEQKISEIESIETQISETHENIKEIASNMQNFKAKSLERRNEIKELYNEIFGTKTEEGEETEGLKDELDACYDKLAENFEKLKKDFIELKTSKEKDFNDFKSLKENDFNELKAKIQSLLPGAMSAGLSSAYNQKRRLEEKIRGKAETTFNIAIIVLVVISAIPVGIASLLLFKMKLDVLEVIKYLPQLLGLIVPIYAPVVWVGLTSSKKVNQSKRLIEEYAHKEAISKTYEGLSREVSKLDDEENLKERLLFNIISTSAENPGKLIQGFNKPDYPMLEIIDKFTKLLKTAKSTNELQSIMDGIISIGQNITGYENKINKNEYKLSKDTNEDDEEA